MQFKEISSLSFPCHLNWAIKAFVDKFISVIYWFLDAMQWVIFAVFCAWIPVLKHSLNLQTKTPAICMLWCGHFTATNGRSNRKMLPSEIVTETPWLSWDRETACDWWIPQIAKFMGPTWGPPGPCRPQMGPMLAPWTLLSGKLGGENSWDVTAYCSIYHSVLQMFIVCIVKPNIYMATLSALLATTVEYMLLP